MKVKIVCECEILILLIVTSMVFCIPVANNIDIFSDNRGDDCGNVSERIGDTSRLPKVLNFFPVPVEEECKANDGRRRGICMNTYECRIQGGKSHGFCALGFGVCCVFKATCNEEVINNITYFVNPNYPDFSTEMSSCSLTIKKIDPEISQIRLDFIHFNLGQPNRKTGVCEEDVFQLAGENEPGALQICGINSGQHVYYDVTNIEEDIKISMNLSKKAVTRFWEVIITQIPFSQKAPPGCFQYHEGSVGLVQTMNFADNGRHLAEQDYNICIRQEKDMCSIAYEPCHDNAFRIAPNTEGVDTNSNLMDDVGSGDGEIVQTFRSMDTCNDKIVLPCDSEELLMPQGMSAGVCSLVHCGSTLCPSGIEPCRIESSITPFTIGVHFGSTTSDSSPEDNLGMCLTYEQIPCGD